MVSASHVHGMMMTRSLRADIEGLRCGKQRLSRSALVRARASLARVSATSCAAVAAAWSLSAFSRARSAVRCCSSARARSSSPAATSKLVRRAASAS